MDWGKEPVKQQKCTVLRRCRGKKNHLPPQLCCDYWFYVLLIKRSIGFLWLANSFSLVLKYCILSKVNMKASTTDVQPK